MLQKARRDGASESEAPELVVVKPLSADTRAGIGIRLLVDGIKSWWTSNFSPRNGGYVTISLCCGRNNEYGFPWKVPFMHCGKISSLKNVSVKFLFMDITDYNVQYEKNFCNKYYAVKEKKNSPKAVPTQCGAASTIWR